MAISSDSPPQLGNAMVLHRTSHHFTRKIPVLQNFQESQHLQTLPPQSLALSNLRAIISIRIKIKTSKWGQKASNFTQPTAKTLKTQYPNLGESKRKQKQQKQMLGFQKHTSVRTRNHIQQRNKHHQHRQPHLILSTPTAVRTKHRQR